MTKTLDSANWLGRVGDDWLPVPLFTFLRIDKTVVGDAWSSTQLLSLTKKGVIERDIESGEGKMPASFEDYQVVQDGDLVLCLFDMDETPRTIGLSRLRGMITGAYRVAKIDERVAEPRFIEYMFLAIDDVKAFKPIYTGLRKTIGREDLLRQRFGLPDLETQRRIADYLDKEISEMDALIEQFEGLIADLENRKSVLIDSVIENGKRIPLGYFVNKIRTGLNPRQNFTLSPEGAEGYYITVRELKGKRIVIDESTVRIDAEAVSMIQERARLAPGDLLFCGTGSIGKTAIVTEIPTNWGMKEGIYALTPTPGKLDTNYLLHALGTSQTKKEIALQSLGSTVASISTEKLLRVTIPFHSFAKQKELSDELDREFERIDALIEESTRLIENLKARKTALITEVVTGRKEV